MKESELRLESLYVSDPSILTMNEVRAAAIALYDIVKGAQKYSAAGCDALMEQNRCFAIAKTKIQEAVFWANRAISYSDCDIQIGDNE